MSNDETKVKEDALETPEEEIVEEETPTEIPDVDIEAIKADAEKSKELAENYKIRAEKAEKKVKETKPEAQDATLSQEDMYRLTRADIHPDDLSVVTKYVKDEGSTEKALANPDLQSILEGRAERRKVAAASNTDNAKTGNSEMSDADLKNKARNRFGSLTEEEIDRLASL